MRRCHGSAGEYMGEHKGVLFYVYRVAVIDRSYYGKTKRSVDWRFFLHWPEHPQANGGGNVVYEDQGTKRNAEATARKIIEKHLQELQTVRSSGPHGGLAISPVVDASAVAPRYP